MNLVVDKIKWLKEMRRFMCIMEINYNTIDNKVDNKRINNINYCKEWYALNRDKHLKTMAETYLCECGRIVNKYKKVRHDKTPLHNRRLSKK